MIHNHRPYPSTTIIPMQTHCQGLSSFNTQLRRSTRSAVSSKRRSPAKPEDDDWQKEDEDNEKESDRGYDAVLKRGPAKRRRTIMTAAAKKTKAMKATSTQIKRKQTEKKRRDLSLLPTMPLDILLTVYTMLSPQDLINLSRVDENFCRTLTANNLSFVWKAVREADGGIEPPQGIPEYRWVDLLFGKSVCDFCPAKNVSVDWTLRRRVCKRCLMANLLCASRVRSHFPDINTEVLNLIPLTYAGPRKMRSSSGYYWIPDVVDIQGEIKELESQPGSSEPLIEFRTSRKKLIEDTYKDVRRCEEWTRANAQKKADDSKQLRDERFSMIKTRLLELGYNERDVQGVRSEPYVVRDVELTPQDWNRMRRGLEVLIKENRAQQAKEDRTMVLFKRSQIVEDVLKVYKRKFLPVVWREMPSYADVCTFPAFRAILELPTEHVVTDASFVDAVDELPTLIADWQRRRESDLKTQVVSGNWTSRSFEVGNSGLLLRTAV
ncbi:hypothetical protein ARMGADRAFT_222874 [Armillaria gallica]|uniref:F-box domain-containing protein n=1 Tax=Armillaria gallica TaxID=47427 RepID=A0A2H3E5L0_ARMGA|nr:hypothetical protein ARMGADRAFT_222874 [Armillaria gallica]